MRQALLAMCALRLRLYSRFLVGELVLDVGMPVALAWIVFRGDERNGLAAGAAAFILTATMALARAPAFVLAIERLEGHRLLLVTAGVTRREYLASNAFAVAYFAAFPIAAFVIARFLVAGWSAPSLLTTAALLLFAVFCHGCGLLLATGFTSLGRLTLGVNALIFVNFSLCPVLYPAARVPDVIAGIVTFLPASLAMELATRGQSHPWTLFAALLLWAVAAVAAGYRLFGWTD